MFGGQRRSCSNPELGWSPVSIAAAHSQAFGRGWRPRRSISISCRACSSVSRSALAKPCFGSTIALRRDTLAHIGGFDAFANTLADDYAMGDAIRRLGLKVEIAPFTVGHTFSEVSFADLWAHELRWARTIRPRRSCGLCGIDRHSSTAVCTGSARIEWLQHHRVDDRARSPCLPPFRSDTS